MADRLTTRLAAGAQVDLAASPTRLGRYELISQLAKGGMGAVYLARSRGVGGFERLVVVKCALPSLAESTQQMLLAEARLAATLQHSNIVQVHDVATEGSTVFLAMEYLHGQDVRHVLRRSWGEGRPLALESAIAIVLAVCAGLHYAHEKRDPDGHPLEIVHRDISPSNVFVTYDGVVKLIDFGIAKATALPSETQLGSIKGKPGYMSPEQCRCEPLDRRSDVFCVGILLYELTLGRKPFRADNEYLLHKQIIEAEPPRPSSVDPAYPVALETIVMRALAKDRRDRQPTALAVQQQLVELASALRLDVSQFALGRFMAERFADDVAEWNHAQSAGVSLVQHVIKRTTSTVRIIDGTVATGSGETLAPAAAAAGASTTADVPTASDIATSPERPTSRPRRRRLWLVPVALAATSVAVAAGIALTSPSSLGSADEPAETPRAPAAETVPAAASTVAPASDSSPAPHGDAPTQATVTATPASTDPASAIAGGREPAGAARPTSGSSSEDTQAARSSDGSSAARVPTATIDAASAARTPTAPTDARPAKDPGTRPPPRPRKRAKPPATAPTEPHEPGPDDIL